MLVADDSALISEHACIDTSSKGTKIIVGPKCQIDAFVRIKCAGGTANIEIGEETYINSGTVMYSGNGLKIGNQSMIAANCTIAPVNHQFSARDKTILEQRFMPSRGGITIGNDVWIGAGSVVLDGTEIPDGVVIGACSLVSGTLEPYTIYAGNPLKKIGERT